MCAMVHNEAGEQEVIAAGGSGNIGDEVEIFNFRSGQWRTGQRKWGFCLGFPHEDAIRGKKWSGDGGQKLQHICCNLTRTL